jgi:dihydrofolate synthase/folylpolyglutamate synthase
MRSKLDYYLEKEFDLKTRGVFNKISEVQTAIDSLSIPTEKPYTINVVGTNGKGTTAYFLSRVFEKAGFDVGMLNCLTVTEGELGKYRINSKPIKTKDYKELSKELYKKIPNSEEISRFEFKIALGYYFLSDKCEILIIEAGCGGRRDATNFVDNDMSIVTNVDKDHIESLGPKIKDIAYQKSGIINSKSTVVSGVTKQVARQEIECECRRHKDVDYYSLDQFDNNMLEEKQQLKYNINIDGKFIETDILGKFVIDNINIALISIEVCPFDIPKKHIISVISDFNPPSKLEIVSEDPTVIVDGAHNKASIKSVCGEDIIKNNTVICNFQKRKEWKSMIDTIDDQEPRKYVFPMRINGNSNQFVTPSLLYESVSKSSVVVDEPSRFFGHIEGDKTIVSVGSLYLAREIRNYFR